MSKHQTSDESALVMEARLLAPEVRAARIAELEAELVRLRITPFVEYPKHLPDGRVVDSAEAEALALAPPDEPAPEPDADEPAPEHASKHKKGTR
jgi:hypothetical protein